MSTTCRIALKIEDEKYESIYCNWDGYPDGVGATLSMYYRDLEKIKELISLGDISYLKSEIGHKQDFENPIEGWTLSYRRDQGEPWEDVKPIIHDDFGSLLISTNASSAIYLYVYEDGNWKTITT